MKIIGNAQFDAAPAEVYQALNDPAVLVRSIPGCHRLEALGDDAYAMTVAAGVGSIKGVYDGQVRLTDHDEPSSFQLHADGSGAAGTISAVVHVTLEEAASGGTSVTYDADASVGGMIGGVGQRMLVGVSKRMAAEFFGNVETVLAGDDARGRTDAGAGGRIDGGPAGLPAEEAGPKPSSVASLRLPPGPSTVPASSAVRPTGSPAAGSVFTAPANGSSGGPGFAEGIVVGAGAALAGALIGAWISRRGRR